MGLARKIALTVGLLCLAAGLCLGGWLWKTSEAAHPSPNPNNAQIESGNSASVQVDWEYWQDENKDVAGWVSIPGTDISLPIVQASADEPDFYLNHDSSKAFNLNGCPYLDAQCAAKGFDSRIALVFGHHMNDGSMFAPLAEYSDKAFASEHSTVLLQTPKGERTYKVIAVDVVDNATATKQLAFKNDASFSKWLDELLKTADLVLDSKASAQHILALCTCSYNRTSDERTIVYAIEI